jgi:hypothetical protein
MSWLPTVPAQQPGSRYRSGRRELSWSNLHHGSPIVQGRQAVSRARTEAQAGRSGYRARQAGQGPVAAVLGPSEACFHRLALPSSLSFCHRSLNDPVARRFVECLHVDAQHYYSIDPIRLRSKEAASTRRRRASQASPPGQGGCAATMTSPAGSRRTDRCEPVRGRPRPANAGSTTRAAPETPGRSTPDG